MRHASPRWPRGAAFLYLRVKDFRMSGSSCGGRDFNAADEDLAGLAALQRIRAVKEAKLYIRRGPLRRGEGIKAAYGEKSFVHLCKP